MTTLTRSGLLLAGLFFFLRTGAQDIIVLNSKSYHPAHHMDDQWSAVAKDAGYSNAILPYSTLDNLEAFSDADIIILSSGYQGISGNGRSNLLEYIKSGGNIYVQSEYLLDLSGNAVFKYIVNEMGNAFEWEGVLDGQVGPVQLNNGLENNDKSIQELVHYWYAAYGCGDQSITPILTKDNKSFGFYYESPLPNTGRMITISDQDWIRIAGQTGQEASLVIMQQALHLLKFGNTKKYTPLILAIDPPFENCNDISIRLESFELDQNKIEWYINDVLITNGPDLDINMIQELDFVYAKYPLEISCSTIEVTSDTFVYHPIEPVLPAPTKLSGKSMICETERLQIAAVTDNSAQIIRHFWYLNGAEQTESGGIFDTDQFEGGDVISHAYSYMQGCSTALLSTQEELTISIKEPSLPNFELIVNNSVIEPCDDTIIRVNASEVDEEQIEWYINDTLVRTGPKISTDLFQEMDFVYAKYWFETDCSRYEIVSDTFVYQPQELIIPESALLTGSTSICNSEVLEISAITDSAAVVIRHFWFVNGIEQAESEATFHTDQFQHGDVISHAYAHKHGCSTSLRPTEEELTIRVLEPSLPSIELFSDRHQTCIGDEVQLNLKGTDLDQNILWYINDQLIENHNDSLVISATLSIQEVFAKVPYIDICGYQNFLETNRINILANEISIQVEEIEHTSCDQPYGLIEVSSN
ncbi:MAG: hypothetical protein KJP00_00385, partial [Bacteroidia bacterium]|nr:hypothetical protein [Bacteroidia bacterium]